MKRTLSILLFALPLQIFPQYLSNLNATRRDPLFTTYAAPVGRSAYKLDQAYQFQWFDPENGVEMISKDGPNTGLAFSLDGKLRFRLNELFREPVVTVSYSDLVCYYYYPFPELRVEVKAIVYSSQWTITAYKVINTGRNVLETGILPYLYLPSRDTLQDIQHAADPDGFTFQIKKPLDGWMKEHNIPLVEDITGNFLSTLEFDSTLTFIQPVKENQPASRVDPLAALKNSFGTLKRGNNIKGIVGVRTIRLGPGESTGFRTIVGLHGDRSPKTGHQPMISTLLEVDPEKLIREDEKCYARIPRLKFENPDQEMLYWSAFSLMRQCMMPPEGRCLKNYYVFSREPKWGWGYGGQVFHESLCMMAYAYMDPEGAMNSQRVYIDRQQKDGYINYRTGPYLDETIETGGKRTTSAPWFNYENLEIFKISKDRQFLGEAYTSGKKFYQFYVANRDSNQNGLCEWGGHAELESVRDAKVAVWDQTGWASNFEGPDVNAMLVKEARSLQEMATILGKSQESDVWKADAERRTRLINEKLWDTATGFYYNVNRNDQSFTYTKPDDLKVKEIIGFLPLWAGVTDAGKTGLVVGQMRDTTEFWRPYGIPSLSAKSNYYCPIGYWNGPVWVQWNYLIFRGLLDYGYKQEAGELSDRVLRNMIYHLKDDHVFWEFYSADDHQAGWNKTYIWAGIAARFLIDLQP